MTFHGGRGRGRRRGFGSEADEPDLPPPDPVEEQKRAKEICFTQLAQQPRTRLELKNAMLRKGITEELAELVLGKFDKAGLIDDAAFAEIWVRSRHTYNGLGRRALAMELRRKGVADELVTEAVAAVDDEAEQDRARELVRKKLRSMSGVDETAKIRRLVSALARKGYPGGMAYQVVREELQAAGEDATLLDDAVPE
jgi:regulatory protein